MIFIFGISFFCYIYFHTFNNVQRKNDTDWLDLLELIRKIRGDLVSQRCAPCRMTSAVDGPSLCLVPDYKRVGRQPHRRRPKWHAPKQHAAARRTGLPAHASNAPTQSRTWKGRISAQARKTQSMRIRALFPPAYPSTIARAAKNNFSDDF